MTQLTSRPKTRAVLLEGHWVSLTLVGFGVLVLIWLFPAESAMRAWVEETAGT